jgi:hypothetical protein
MGGGPAGGGVTLDLTVRNVEVTQSIQTLDNSVPLVANKPTLARVYVGVEGTAEPVEGVDAILHVYQDGLEVPDSPFHPINGPIVAQLTPNREREDDTLNFRLPALSGRYDMVATVNPDFVIPEIDYGNNDYEVDNLDFVCRLTPDISYVVIDYRFPDPTVPHLPDGALMAAGNRFLDSCYPFPPSVYHPAARPPYVFARDVNGHDAELLAALAQIKQELIPTPTFLFGWLPAGAFDSHGETSPSQGVAFGNADPGRSQSIIAHEMGHFFGLEHNYRQIGEVGVDVDNRVGLGRIKPHDLYDIMDPGLLTAERWIDPISYRAVFASDILTCDKEGAPGEPPRIPVSPAEAASRLFVAIPPLALAGQPQSFQAPANRPPAIPDTSYLEAVLWTMTGPAAAAPGPAAPPAADQGVGDVPGDGNADFVAAHEGEAWPALWRKHADRTGASISVPTRSGTAISASGRA